MILLISLTINAAAFVCVLKLSKKWAVTPLAAGVVGFIIYFARWQSLSGGMAGLAAAFDQHLALLRFWYFLLMAFWLVIGVRGGIRLMKSPEGKKIGKMMSSAESGLDKIAKAKALLDAGAISSAEYEQIKKDELAR
jgi:hypothetical protein